MVPNEPEHLPPELETGREIMSMRNNQYIIDKLTLLHIAVIVDFPLLLAMERSFSSISLQLNTCILNLPSASTTFQPLPRLNPNP